MEKKSLSSTSKYILVVAISALVSGILVVLGLLKQLPGQQMSASEQSPTVNPFDSNPFAETIPYQNPFAPTATVDNEYQNPFALVR